MLPYRDSRLTKIALTIFFVLVLAYGYYEARGILFGPIIEVSESTSEMHEPFVHIKGHADRISELLMNGKQIPVTEDGTFDEPYLLLPGLNRIHLDATDKYGRSRHKVIEIVYVATTTPSITAATTTTSVSTSTATTTDGATSSESIAPTE